MEPVHRVFAIRHALTELCCCTSSSVVFPPGDLKEKLAKNVSYALLTMWMCLKINPLPPSDTVRKQKITILEDLFSSVVSQLKKKSPPCEPEFRHFPKLKIAYFNGKILSISLKLNFTPCTLGCYGLRRHLKTSVPGKYSVDLV